MSPPAQAAAAPTAPALALALGGGAARGYAHLGVLAVLQEAGLPPDVLSGTSMGALVGAVYLTSPAVSEAIRRFRVVLQDPDFREFELNYMNADRQAGFWDTWVARMRRGLLVTQAMVGDAVIERELLARILRALVPDRRIEELPRRFACVSTNLSRRRRHVWTAGRLLEGVAASVAIPGIFPPATVGGELHVDGGAVEMVPVPTARELGATFTIAVQLEDAPRSEHPEVGVQLFLAANEVTQRILQRQQLQDADVLLKPAVGSLHWADLRNLDAAVAVGRDVAAAHIEEIRYLWQDHQRGFRKGVWAWLSGLPWGRVRR